MALTPVAQPLGRLGLQPGSARRMNTVLRRARRWWNRASTTPLFWQGDGGIGEAEPPQARQFTATVSVFPPAGQVWPAVCATSSWRWRWP